jgi:hypothetical protein
MVRDRGSKGMDGCPLTQGPITEGVVSVYLNNILIFINSIEEHHYITRLVLDRMHEHKLYLRPEKCEFEDTWIEYMGVIISHNKVKMDKVAGVADCPLQQTRKRCSPLSDSSISIVDSSLTSHTMLADNLYTTQTPECTKDKYDAKIKVKGSLLRSHQQPT